VFFLWFKQVSRRGHGVQVMLQMIMRAPCLHAGQGYPAGRRDFNDMICAAKYN
jgi:hypothetical protein